METGMALRHSVIGKKHPNASSTQFYPGVETRVNSGTNPGMEVVDCYAETL